MKVFIALAVSFMVAVVMAGIVAISSYVKFSNMGNEYDNMLSASYSNMENVLGQYSLKIGEMIQVPALQKDALVELFSKSNESRYGENGSGATMQWIKEMNPNFDQSTFVEVQRAIVAGRNEFSNEQSKFLDKKQQYQNQLGYVWSGFWLKLAGYPKVSLDTYKLISSNHAKQTFETGIDTGLKLK